MWILESWGLRCMIGIPGCQEAGVARVGVWVREFRGYELGAAEIKGVKVAWAGENGLGARGRKGGGRKGSKQG